MSDEQDIEKKLETYRELAKEDPKVDAALLMTNALEQSAQNEISAKKKKWAYLISLGLPPLGLFIAAWYLIGDKTDRKKVAAICAILTLISGLISWAIAKAVLSSVDTSSLNQIQNMHPDDLKSLLQ